MKQTLLAIGLSLLFLVNANAQWTSGKSNDQLTVMEGSFNNIFGSTIEDSTLTLLIIGANGDTVGIRGQFQFWRTNRYVPQDSLYTIAQIISYVTGLGYATQTWTYQSKDSSLVAVTLGSGAFIMGNVASGWYEANYQTVLDTLAAKGSLNMTQMAALMSGESGTGNVVMSNSPTLVTPALGTPSALTLTNATGLPISGVTNLQTNLNARPDTLAYHWGVMDTVTVGDLVAYKVESNITVVKVSAYGTADSVLFNIQERAAGTPTTAGDSLFASPMWANSTGKDSTSFTGSGGANFAKNTWIQPVVINGLDATRFGVTVWYIKQSY